MQPGGDGPIYPAESTPGMWTVLAIVFLALAVLIPVLVAWWCRRHYRQELENSRGAGIEPVRRDYLKQLDALSEQWRKFGLSEGEALRQASSLTKQFVGVVTDTDIESLTLDELEERALVHPELKPVAGVVKLGYESRFAGDAIGSDQVGTSLCQARKVVAEWV